MEKNGKTKNIVLAVLLVAVVTLSIAYALLSATLTINAQATVTGATWDVEFQSKEGVSPICTPSSRNGAASTTASVTQQPTINATSFSGLEAQLKLPGDKVVCTWQVINKGTINAKLATYNPLTLSYDGAAADVQKVTGHINTTLEVGGAAPVAGTDVLPATTGNVKDVVLTIEFDPNATSDNLPAGNVTVAVGSETFIYQQN